MCVLNMLLCCAYVFNEKMHLQSATLFVCGFLMLFGNAVAVYATVI